MIKRYLLYGAALLVLLAGCRKREIPVERIVVNPEVVKLFVGETQEIHVECYPSTATNLDQLTVGNSNPEVADFEDGKLLAKLPGKSQLLARCGDVSAKSYITVYSGFFTKGGQKYGVETASGYYYLYGQTTAQEMEIELTAYEANGDEQHFCAWIKCGNLGKTIDFMKDMDESQVSVWKNQNEDGYSIPYKKEDGTPAVVAADWGYTDAVLTRGLLTITDLTSGRYRVEADFELSNGYKFTAEWEGYPSMKNE